MKSSEPERLASVLTHAGAQISGQPNREGGGVVVRSLDARHIGELAAHAGIVLWELSPQLASLEDAFRELTHNNRDFSAAPTQLGDGDSMPVLAGSAPAGGTR